MENILLFGEQISKFLKVDAGSWYNCTPNESRPLLRSRYLFPSMFVKSFLL